MSSAPTRLRQACDEVHWRVIHGYRRAFRMAGDGPAVLLIHGVGDRSATWLPVMAELARSYQVIVPDLLGHGASDKPRADYSVAGYANGMRDLLGVLGIERVSLVGHSLGGGVAMQFAYQFPERVERLTLVSSGGLGQAVHPALRMVSVPGASLLLSALRFPGARAQTAVVVRALKLLNTDLGLDAPDLIRLADALPDLAARSALVRALRSVVDWRGQAVTMLDRAYLTTGMPTLLVWGARDAVLPVEHARTARSAMPGSRLEIFADAGHFPFHTDAARFVQIINEFMATTEPARWTPEQWRELLRTGRAELDPRLLDPGQPTTSQAELKAASERSAT